MELDLLRRVGFFCALFTVQCCAAVLGTISRDTIFLRSYAASSIAALTLVLSFSTAYALTLANGLVLRMTARQIPSGIVYALSPAVLGVGTLALAIVSLGMPLLARGISVTIYIWLEISTQWLTQQFWDLCAKSFDVSQSKKFFGFITFGTTFGSLLASFVVLPLVQQYQLPTECNLVVAAFMLFFIAAVLFVSAEHFAPATGSASTSKRSGSTSSKAKQAVGDSDTEVTSAAIITDIQARTYLKHICFFDMLATVIRVLVDNTTLSVLSLQDEDEVKASLTHINGVQSFIMIPMQLASGPFFTHFGVMYGISMLPVAVFLFGASTYASNSAYSLILTRALYNAVSQAIFNPARQLLWLPFNDNERGRFRSFVCGPFRSLSRIFGAVLSMVLTSGAIVQFLGDSSLRILMTVASIAWFIDALAARKSYAAEFYASLRQGYLDLTSPLIDFTPDQILIVKETLVNGAQDQANFVLSSISHEHIALFSQELRGLFYKTSRDNVPLTPLHTKLRLLNLHTAAKRDFVLHAQESYLLPDASTFPTGIFNTMDLMMIVQDKTLSVPRQLRVAAILACGYEKFNIDADQCSQMLRKLMQNGDEEKSVVVCAAVALLRLSDWMDEEANVILQKLLHEEKALDSRVVGLKIIGKELPELLGDGFLVYLLHHSSPQIVQAAVECCSNSSRNSRMLIPALMKHLPDSMLRSQIVEAFKWFDPAALWGTLCQYTEETLQLPSRGTRSNALVNDRMHSKREGLAGALKVLEMGEFPFQDKLDFLLHLVETLLVTPKSMDSIDAPEGEMEEDFDVLLHLVGKDVIVEELVVDALLSLISTTDEKTMHAYSHLMNPIHLALDIKIREAHEMRHVLELFNRICPRANIEDTSPLLLQHVEHSLKDSMRLLLKLLSTGFPKEFDVAVILEGLQSDLEQVHSAIQEVLENLLPSSYKGLVLPLLFPKFSATKATTKMEKEIASFFCEKNGVGILLDVMKHQKAELELSALALQYFLHVAADHADHLDQDMKATFQDDIIPHLLKHELTKELLIETFHSRPDVLPYESLTLLQNCESPLLSRIAVSNCLRVSSLFESVCAISILRVLSHHFVPMRVQSGETFAVEGDIASALYVVAVGTVQLHKQRRILAELGFGTCVGQAALLQHAQQAGTHICSATALTDCTLLSISREDLDALMKETPSVSRGVLNAVASSLRLLYFEPLTAIAQSGCLPRRDRTPSTATTTVQTNGEVMHPMLKMAESLTSNIRAALTVERAAKSFLYDVGRSRTADRTGPLSIPGVRGRHRSLSGVPSMTRSLSSGALLSKGLLALSDPADYSNFEKCIHLKGSHIMRDLDDDKMSLVAQLSRVVVLNHGDTVFFDGGTMDCVYVIIDGTVEIVCTGNESEALKLRNGDCFGEESFVPNAKAHGTASSVGRCTLFEITTKELVDLSELHHDIVHVILAWLAQKLAESTRMMIAPLLSPIVTSPPGVFWEDEESASELRNRAAKWRAESD